MTDETEKPIADGPDSWWKASAPVDAAAKEERDILAKDFHDERVARYLESGGTDQVGGFVSPSLSGRGRQIDWRRMPRGNVWS
jgi:hypothetical protein